ncbi:MAG: type II toxin-antitoxin system RelE/ParE family toxin [Clostridiales bacterium]|nr:type II toxin-antitoxin system RelE/ParE family toxin [Clostridiales bacterium]
MPEKNWKLELSKDSWKYIKKLGKRNGFRILDRLEELCKKGNPIFQKDVRRLEGKLKGFYRLRIGDLRVIFEVDWEEKRIGVLAVVPRGNAY